MSHHPTKKPLEEDYRNTNIHMHKRKYQQALSPKSGPRFSHQREDYPNDNQFRRIKRLRESQEEFHQKQNLGQGPQYQGSRFQMDNYNEELNQRMNDASKYSASSFEAERRKYGGRGDSKPRKSRRYSSSSSGSRSSYSSSSSDSRRHSKYSRRRSSSHRRSRRSPRRDRRSGSRRDDKKKNLIKSTVEADRIVKQSNFGVVKQEERQEHRPRQSNFSSHPPQYYQNYYQHQQPPQYYYEDPFRQPGYQQYQGGVPQKSFYPLEQQPVNQVQINQSKQNGSSQSFGVLVYGMSQDNFEKWKDLCSKILGAKDHHSINRENFEKAKSEYTRLIQTDEQESRQKYRGYLNEENIKKHVQSQLLSKSAPPKQIGEDQNGQSGALPHTDGQNLEMKNEDSNAFTQETQDSSQFDISYESSTQLLNVPNPKLDEINQRLYRMDRERQELQLQLESIETKKELFLKNLEVKQARLNLFNRGMTFFQQR